MILPVFGHDRFGILRGFWTFPQESILFQAKKATRKMTNHKSVSYACVGLFIMERLLSQIFTPERDIPKKWGVHGGIRVDAASQKLPLPLPPKEEITLNATITHNYQDYSPNVFAKLTTGYVKITKTAVESMALEASWRFSARPPRQRRPSYVKPERPSSSPSACYCTPATWFRTERDTLL